MEDEDKTSGNGREEEEDIIHGTGAKNALNLSALEKG
jgi:hypothetical protein